MSSKVMIRYVNGLVFEWTYYIVQLNAFGHLLRCLRRYKICLSGFIFLYRDLNSTVTWLAQETASRYQRLTGLQCALSIQLGDGSVLSPDDPVTLLLSSKEEVTVTSSPYS